MFQTPVWPSLAQLLLKLGRLELFNLTRITNSALPPPPPPSRSAPTAPPVIKGPTPLKMSRDHLSEALDIIVITHGKDNSLYAEAKELYESACSFDDQQQDGGD